LKDKIFLIGYRATGKSAVGERVASLMGWSFHDLDLFIEEKTGVSIKEIVEKKGWGPFRQLEKEALEEYLRGPGKRVVACGGGAVLHREFWPEIKKVALVVWLKAKIETILARMANDSKTETQRPTLCNGMTLSQEIATVLAERTPLYEKFSHIAIDTDAYLPDLIAEQIVKEYKKRCQETASANISK